MAITESDRIIIGIGVVIFNIVGNFGNANVLYAHYRLKSLRTKHGSLLTILVTAHTICLLFELVGLVYDISVIPIYRKLCFYIISPYIFCISAQMALLSAISADLLISIAAPLRHKTVSTKLYLIILITPAILFGLIILIMGVIFMDNEKIDLCQPPLSLSLVVRRVWPIFIFLINCFEWSGHPKEAMDRAKAYMVFPALTVCSSTFYICFARSVEYRRIFWFQIVKMFGRCGIKLNKNRYCVDSSTIAHRQSTIISRVGESTESRE